LSDGKGGLIAIVIGAFDTDSGKPVPASISEKCRAELHGQPGELARVTLSPRPAVAVERLDASFMAECAPAELFFPITDVLNISRAQMFPGLSGLKRPGDRVQAPGFATWLDRSGASVDESSPGAAIRFVALTPDRATIDWLPKPMAVTVTTHGGAGNSDSVLSGFEDIGYRLEIDPRTGVLLSAVTTHDRIDLTLSLPDGRKVPLNLTRDVVIAPRKDS
ncbi:MAG: hypothetical protein ACAH11_11045, partial [Sphingomonas sp.]